MNFFFQEKVWRSIEVPEDKEKRVARLIRRGDINKIEDIFDSIGDAVTINDLDSTNDQIDPEFGHPTIEIFDDSGGFLWDNDPASIFEI